MCIVKMADPPAPPLIDIVFDGASPPTPPQAWVRYVISDCWKSYNNLPTWPTKTRQDYIQSHFEGLMEEGRLKGYRPVITTQFIANQWKNRNQSPHNLTSLKAIFNGDPVLSLPLRANFKFPPPTTSCRPPPPSY
jgi:hypothetical protein